MFKRKNEYLVRGRHHLPPSSESWVIHAEFLRIRSEPSEYSSEIGEQAKQPVEEIPLRLKHHKSTDEMLSSFQSQKGIDDSLDLPRAERTECLAYCRRNCESDDYR